MTDSGVQHPVPTASDLLMMDEIAPDRFRTHHNLDNLVGATFGGQALGQALAAAQRTAPDWPAHNVSGLFTRAGKLDRPLDFAVERVNDGRRFAARRVLASQDGRPMFDLLASFHAPEEGPAHQAVDWGNPPAPEDLPSMAQLARAQGDKLPPRIGTLMSQPFPIEMRPLDPECLFKQPGGDRRDFWFRMPSATQIDDIRAIRRCC